MNLADAVGSELVIANRKSGSATGQGLRRSRPMGAAPRQPALDPAAAAGTLE